MAGALHDASMRVAPDSFWQQRRVPQARLYFESAEQAKQTSTGSACSMFATPAQVCGAACGATRTPEASDAAAQHQPTRVAAAGTCRRHCRGVSGACSCSSSFGLRSWAHIGSAVAECHAARWEALLRITCFAFRAAVDDAFHRMPVSSADLACAVEVTAERIELSWAGPSAVHGLRVASRVTPEQSAVSVSRMQSDTGLLSLLLGECLQCSVQPSLLIHAIAFERVHAVLKAGLLRSIGRQAKLSIEGLSLDAMLDETGEFRILQLLPRAPSKPGETWFRAVLPVLARVHHKPKSCKCLRWQYCPAHSASAAITAAQ